MSRQVLSELDHFRDDIPRSRMIEMILRERLGIPSPLGLVASSGDE